MTWAAVVGAGVSLVGGALGSSASKQAAGQEASAASESALEQQNMYNDTVRNVNPWLRAGGQSLDMLMAGVAGGSLNPTPYTPFTMAQFQEDPGYQFQLSQGQNALTNASSLSGGSNSNNLKGLINYTQGAANSDYQTALTNYINQYQLGNQAKQQTFSNLSSISQGGMGAALQQGQIGTSAGANIGTSLMNAGAAQAAGTVGAANAWGNAATSGYNAYLQSQYMNQGAAIPASIVGDSTGGTYGSPYWAAAPGQAVYNGTS